MTWTKIRSDEDFPEEGQLVIGKYLCLPSGPPRYYILKYHTDEGRAFWDNTLEDMDEGEPDFWQAFEL